MIPKKIHYCWFGGAPLSKRALRCMDSWKHFCPDYEIVRWDESNSPLSDCTYVRQACQRRKWAFASDYVRLTALCEQGGIYLDTDVELVAPLDAFLEQEAFLGLERAGKAATCLMACEPGHPFFRRALEQYSGLSFLREDGSVDDTTNVERLSALLAAEGLREENVTQRLCGVTVYPTDYFCPKSLDTGRITRTPRTCAIHHFDASWMPVKKRVNTRLAQLLGPKLTRTVKRMLGRERA